MAQRQEIRAAQQRVWGDADGQLCAEHCGREASAGSCYCAVCEAELYQEEGTAGQAAPVAAAAAPAVATCAECGGKYRPAGGPCIHEQTTDTWRQLEASYGRPPFMAQGQQVPPSRIGWDVLCYDCKQGWRPGHTCIRQPTAQERQALLDQAEWLRIMDDVLEHFGHKTALAAPEVWEAI